MKRYWVGVLVVMATSWLRVMAQDAAPPAAHAPLTAEAVADRLEARNQERAAALHRFASLRTYHLQYRGFPSDKDAEMIVRMDYQSPATKHFEIVSQSGSKIILDRVFKKLLESEQEALSQENREHTALTRANYDFQLLEYRQESSGPVYVLHVEPKVKSKFLYRGQVWVDGTDFAVMRIQAEPAKSPSFWTKKSEIEHEYTKIQGFWFPARNRSESWIRLGGHATLTIEYGDYRILEAAALTENVTAKCSSCSQ